MGLQFCNEMTLATQTVFSATETAASVQSSPSMSTGICSQVNKKISVLKAKVSNVVTNAGRYKIDLSSNIDTSFDWTKAKLFSENF